MGGIVYLNFFFQIISKFLHLEKLVKVAVPRLWHFVLSPMNVVPDVEKSVSRHDPVRMLEHSKPSQKTNSLVSKAVCGYSLRQGVQKMP